MLLKVQFLECVFRCKISPGNRELTTYPSTVLMVLNCSFYGAYVDAINWTRNGQPVEGKHIMVDPQVDKMWSAVVLDNVTRQQDVGKFECEAKRDQKVSSCFARPSKFSLLLICFLRFSYFSV